MVLQALPQSLQTRDSFRGRVEVFIFRTRKSMTRRDEQLELFPDFLPLVRIGLLAFMIRGERIPYSATILIWAERETESFYVYSFVEQYI